MPASLSLTPQKRIKQGRDFRLTRSNGKRLALGSLIINWAPAQRTSGNRLGVITSRRVGKAHHRSRARRLLRECFRKHQHDITDPTDIVLIARPSIVGKACGDVERDFLAALRRAKLLKLSE